MRLLRQSLPALHFSGLIHDQGHEIAAERLRWIGQDNRKPDWQQDQAVGLLLSGRAEHLGRTEEAEDVLIFFNASDKPVKFHLPDTEHCKWKMRAYTTARRVHRTNLGTILVTKPHSLVLFSALRTVRD
jgi:pullulanase/glycogen debranching enzyme